jgi:hypothetical protein
MPETRHLSASVTPIEERAIRWQVRVISLLLLLEALGMGGIIAFLASTIDWNSEASAILFSAEAVAALINAFWAGVLIILLLLAALGFALRRRFGWLLAMMAQGATLLGGLVLYFQADPRPWYVFPTLAYAVFMALYVNSADIRLAFRV